MEHQVTSEQMNSLAALANTNIEISKAKGALFSLQGEEKRYLEQRERRAIARIESIVAESAETLKEARDNWYETTQLYATAGAFASALVAMQELFAQTVAEFDERCISWDKSAESQQNALKELKREISSDRARIENDKKAIERAKAAIESDKALIESRQAQIRSALQALDEKKGNG